MPEGSAKRGHAGVGGVLQNAPEHREANPCHSKTSTQAASTERLPAMTPTSIKPSIPPGIPNVEYAGVSYGSLRGRGVIVTGGAGGIGADIVRGFAQQGCKVGFLDRDAASGRALAASLPGTQFEVCDVADVPALQAAIASLAEGIGGVDVLVNNVANDERHSVAAVT